MNARRGKKLRVASVERNTYIRQRRTELDGPGLGCVQKTHERYRMRQKQGPNEVYNGKNVIFFEAGIIFGCMNVLQVG
jgi:hypothetical protein